MFFKSSVLSLILLCNVSFFSCAVDNNEDNDAKYNNVYYTESDSVIINPERGFYSHKEYSSNGTSYFTQEAANVCRQSGKSLVFMIFYLKDFRDCPISDEFLSIIDKSLNNVRAGGCKVVLRFAYTDNEDDKPWDAPQDVALEHIKQLKPYLNKYSDIIYVMEAGFVGVWGEWYYTTNFNYEPSSASDYAPRRALLDALLDALPADRMICVRTPAFKLKCFGITYSDTITRATAYNGTALSRIACHDDAFLSTSSDMGTFNSVADREFWNSETKYVAMGGETDLLSSYSSSDKAISGMEKLHMSYLNADYISTVLGAWTTGGIMPEIKKRMGYRFVLKEGEFSKKALTGQKYEVRLTIKNAGFAAPVNPRNVELILKSKTNPGINYKISLSDDPRYWFAGGEYLVDAQFGLPEDMAEGEYDIYLNLPDPKANLANRPEYSIRLANTGTWNALLGYNKINTITVTKSGNTSTYKGEFLKKI